MIHSEVYLPTEGYETGNITLELFTTHFPLKFRLLYAIY